MTDGVIVLDFRSSPLSQASLTPVKGSSPPADTLLPHRRQLCNGTFSNLGFISKPRKADSAAFSCCSSGLNIWRWRQRLSGDPACLRYLTHVWSCQCVMQQDLSAVGLCECFCHVTSVRSTPGGTHWDRHPHDIIQVTLLAPRLCDLLPSHPHLTRVSCICQHFSRLRWAEAEFTPGRTCSHTLSEV